MMTVLPITISTTEHQSTVNEVQGVVVPISREVGQEARGGAVGLREESLDMSAGIPGEASGHDQDRTVVITHHLHHLLLRLAGQGARHKAEDSHLEILTLKEG